MLLSALLALAGRAFADSDVEAREDAAEEDAAGEAASELARGSLDVGTVLVDESFASTSGLVDVASARDAAARSEATSRWGRIDLSVAWRRTWRTARELARSETSARTQQVDELWLVATWRH